jgi:hypothetical protein
LEDDEPKCHITCDVCDIDNEELVNLVGEGMVETCVSHDVVGRLMLQCSLRAGLAQTLDSLLGFEVSYTVVSYQKCRCGEIDSTTLRRGVNFIWKTGQN